MIVVISLRLLAVLWLDSLVGHAVVAACKPVERCSGANDMSNPGLGGQSRLGPPLSDRWPRFAVACFG